MSASSKTCCKSQFDKDHHLYMKYITPILAITSTGWHWSLLLVTRMLSPMPHVLEQGLHSVDSCLQRSPCPWSATDGNAYTHFNELSIDFLFCGRNKLQ